MMSDARAVQTVSREERITELVVRFHSMAGDPEQRPRLHTYFYVLDIDHSVPGFAIMHGTKPVSDDDLAHVRDALGMADDDTLGRLYSATSVPAQVGIRSEGPAKRASQA